MEIDKFLLGFLSKTQEKTEDEIKSLIYKDDDSGELKDNVLETLLNLDKERVAAFKTETKTAKDEQYNRAKREVSEDWEKKIKATFGLSDTESIGDDLLAEALASKPGDGGEKDKLTDDDVKKHPVYQQLQKNHQEEIKSINTDWEGKLSDKEAEFNRTTTMSSVSKSALAKAKALNPVLPENAEIAERQLSMVVTQLKSLGYDFKQNGDSFDVLKDGELAKDGHDKLISFDDLVTGVTKSLFVLGEKTPGDGTGNKNDFDKTQFKNIKTPKTPEEFKSMTEAAKTSEERTAIAKAWSESQKAADA